MCNPTPKANYQMPLIPNLQAQNMRTRTWLPSLFGARIPPISNDVLIAIGDVPQNLERENKKKAGITVGTALIVSGTNSLALLALRGARNVGPLANMSDTVNKVILTGALGLGVLAAGISLWNDLK